MMRYFSLVPLLDGLSDPVGRLSRKQKRRVMMAADGLLVSFSLWAAIGVRLDSLWPGHVWTNGWWLLLVLPVIGVCIFHWMGLYRIVLRSMGRTGSVLVVQAVLLLSLMIMAFAYFIPQIFIPRLTPVIFSLILSLSMISLRALGSGLLWLPPVMQEGF